MSEENVYLPRDVVALVLRAAYNDISIDTRRALKIRPRRIVATSDILSELWARRSESWARYEKTRKLDNGIGLPIASITSGFGAARTLWEFNDYVIMRIERVTRDPTFSIELTHYNVATGVVMLESKMYGF